MLIFSNWKIVLFLVIKTGIWIKWYLIDRQQLRKSYQDLKSYRIGIDKVFKALLDFYIFRYISSSELMSLVKPLADRLSQVSTFKNIAKIKDCLRSDTATLRPDQYEVRELDQ